MSHLAISVMSPEMRVKPQCKEEFRNYKTFLTSLLRGEEWNISYVRNHLSCGKNYN